MGRRSGEPIGNHLVGKAWREFLKDYDYGKFYDAIRASGIDHSEVNEHLQDARTKIIEKNREREKKSRRR